MIVHYLSQLYGTYLKKKFIAFSKYFLFTYRRSDGKGAIWLARLVACS